MQVESANKMSVIIFTSVVKQERDSAKPKSPGNANA